MGIFVSKFLKIRKMNRNTENRYFPIRIQLEINSLTGHFDYSEDYYRIKMLLI